MYGKMYIHFRRFVSNVQKNVDVKLVALQNFS